MMLSWQLVPLGHKHMLGLALAKRIRHFLTTEDPSAMTSKWWELLKTSCFHERFKFLLFERARSSYPVDWVTRRTYWRILPTRKWKTDMPQLFLVAKSFHWITSWDLLIPLPPHLQDIAVRQYHGTVIPHLLISSKSAVASVEHLNLGDWIIEKPVSLSMCSISTNLETWRRRSRPCN